MIQRRRFYSVRPPGALRPDRRSGAIPAAGPDASERPIGTDTADWAVSVPIGYWAGRWRIALPIATGSWGSVYQATRAADGASDAELPTEAAIKFLPTGTVTPRQLGHLAEMARRERSFYERLVHPRLLRLHETFTLDDPQHPQLDGSTVLVMEMADRSLAEVLREHVGRPVSDAPRLIIEICEGLAHMHTSGWVHGDLKPSNLLIMADGSVRLADFGLATELEGTHGYLPPVGCSDYMPPERADEPLDERGTAVRTTADTWALGVIAAQLLTGRMPFPGTTAGARAAAAAEYAQGRQQLVLPLALAPPWRAFVGDCLEPAHDRRASHDTTTLLSRARALAKEPVTTEQFARAAVRRTRVRTVAGTVGTLLVLALGVVVAPNLPGVGEGDGTSSIAAERFAQWLRPDSDVPLQYRGLIVDAGTSCPEPSVSPALVAAMLKAESGFDPDLVDPVADEYGIARWTPRVLRAYMPIGQRSQIPEPPFPPEVSIPAVGRYLCVLAPQLADLPGEQPLLLAAAYRSSATVVRSEGIPARWQDYVDRVRQYLADYRP